MNTEKRLQIIGNEIKIAEKDLIHSGFCGAEFTSDIYLLDFTKKKVQIKVILTTDEDEFENPTKSFVD